MNMTNRVIQVLALEETLDPNWKSNVSLGY
jgi:hypothetical protein